MHKKGSLVVAFVLFMKKRWIWLGVIGFLSGIYFGWTSGSASLMIRVFVGVAMGLLISWLVSGFLK